MPTIWKLFWFYVHVHLYFGQTDYLKYKKQNKHKFHSHNIMTTFKGLSVWLLTRKIAKKIAVCGGNTQRDRSILQNSTSTYMTSVRWRRRPKRVGNNSRRLRAIILLFLSMYCSFWTHLHAETVVEPGRWICVCLNGTSLSSFAHNMTLSSLNAPNITHTYTQPSESACVSICTRDPLVAVWKFRYVFVILCEASRCKTADGKKHSRWI